MTITPSPCKHTGISRKVRSTPDFDIDMTAGKIRLERRKIQNRLNQRTHRSRVRDRRVSDTTKPYRVHRWRIDDGRDDIPYIKPNKGPSDSTCVPVEDKSAPSNDMAVSKHPNPNRESNRELVSVSFTIPGFASSPWPALSYCLLSDHLLHLIHFNVLRGLSYNKKVIKPNAFLECTCNPSDQLKRVLPQLPDTSALSGLRLPESLAPTKLQLSCPHSNWIDVFPFPKMRDNLIRWENSFSHAEFLTDLLGNLISCMAALPSSRVQDAAQGGNEDVPSDRRGLILWGEPFHKDSWEVTPGFLSKWSWAVDGCGELLESTNRWRTARGETPLRMAITLQ